MFVVLDNAGLELKVGLPNIFQAMALFGNDNIVQHTWGKWRRLTVAEGGCTAQRINSLPITHSGPRQTVSTKSQSFKIQIPF